MNKGFYEFSRPHPTSSVFPYTGSAIISGSLNVTGSVVATSFTGSLFGTATQAISASYSNNSTSASYSLTSSFAVSSSRAVSSSQAQNAVSASNALTASYITSSNVFGPFGANSITTASYALTSSWAVSASWAPTQNINTSSLVTTSSFNAFTSSYNTGSFTGSFTGTLIGTSSWATNSVTASYITSSNVYGPFGSNSITSASFAVTASYALQAVSASFAQTASYSKNLQISGSINNVDYIDFNTGSTVTQPTPGRLSWNDTDGTLDIGLKGGNVTLQIGQEEVARVVNKTGGNLLEADYHVVRIRSVAEGGAQGQRLAVVLAQANNDTNSATTLGLVTEDITVNQEGFITLSGQVRGINTTGTLQGETWTDGDVLYLSPTTPGHLTNIKPQAPQHTVIVGYVEYAHNNQGKIFVKVDNGYEIDELHNVRIDTGSLTPGQLLVRSGSVWVNSNQLTGSYGLTGSLSATSFTGSLFGTSSWAENAQSASFATSTVSGSIQGQLDGKQTTVLDSFTVIANNTNSSTNGASQTFKSIANQTYTGTPVWTGTTAPSGITTHSYSWNQIGNLVTVRINLVYATGGSALTAVTIPLPTDCPAPYVASGGTPSTNRVLTVGTGVMQTNFAVSTVTTYVILKTNSTNTGFDIIAQRASANYQMVTVMVTYLTN